MRCARERRGGGGGIAMANLACDVVRRIGDDLRCASRRGGDRVDNSGQRLVVDFHALGSIARLQRRGRDDDRHGFADKTSRIDRQRMVGRSDGRSRRRRA